MEDLAAPNAVRLTPPVTQLLVMTGFGAPSYTKCNIYIVSFAGVSLSQFLFGTKCVAVSVAAVNDLPLHSKGSVVVIKLSLLYEINLLVIVIGAVLTPYWFAPTIVYSLALLVA